ncbi:MAG: 30S ribosomal protein S4e [Candidatus Hadarchaeales archaeon]
MARKGGKRQLKRYAIPKAMKIPKKKHPWVIKTSAGPHPAEMSIPLGVVLRDYLGVARNSREIRRVLSSGLVKVDGKVRRDPKFPVGFMDLVSLPLANKSFRCLLDRRGRLVFKEVGGEEAGVKLCRVKRKNVVGDKKIQLTLHDGRNLVGDYKDVRPGDTLKISLPESRPIERFEMKTGVIAIVTGGKNIGKIGAVKEIKLVKGSQHNLAVLEWAGESFEAPVDYVFVVGNEKPAIDVQVGAE